MSSDDDTFIAAIAREIRHDDRMFIGNNQPDVVLAAFVARRSWAPRLKLWVSGQAAIDPGRDTALAGLSSLSRGFVGNRSTFFWQARAFDAMGRRSAVCFAGGLQVDGRGNANLAGIRAADGWSLRGPGSAGMPSLTAWAPRFYIVMPRHDPHFLVERCSAVSVVGDPATRASLGMAPQALAGVITPLATFVPSPNGLVVAEISEGVGLTELGERTGFPLRHGDVRTRSRLTAEEQHAIAAVRADASRNSLGIGRSARDTVDHDR